VSFVKGLECSQCGRLFPQSERATVCTDCQFPLLVRYHLDRIKRHIKKTTLLDRPTDMWRYVEVMPVDGDEDIVTLGEGYTPLLPLPRLGRTIGLRNLYLKDESLNPTGTFKARGLSAAVSMAKKGGVRKMAIPSAGNAGGALAAYGARAGLEVFIAMPLDTPSANVMECRLTGARVELVAGLIGDAAKVVNRLRTDEGWFDMSTLREPYRLEGKKTIGYEILEQFRWKVPDVVVCPVGGGMSLIGIWKALQEMEELGWITSRRPRLVAVQSEGCAPVVKAFHDAATTVEPWAKPQTFASGIRIPKPLGDFLILETLRESRGFAMAVADEDIYAALQELSREEGVFMCPEGAAGWEAVRRLRKRGWINDGETVVLLNTGAGVKYIDTISQFEKEHQPVESVPSK
jgi:threonine synthase